MARPAKPLISRTAAVAAALTIIDDDGLDAFSLPKLAQRLGVATPSLYHHFSDRTELLSEVTRSIVNETRVPRQPADGNWQDWIVRYALNFRDVVLRHPNAAPAMLQFLPRDLVTDMWERAATYLVESGVPVRLHVQILDGLEKLTLGVALTEAVRPAPQRAKVFAKVDKDAHPTLYSAMRSNRLTPRQLHEQMMRSFLHGVLHDNQVQDAPDD
ncbi:TetR family transcriptional regulator [Amycolatopsis jejuensis]|uniref:TetR family transcriptional regulator n=1 Tax=Amycolatopsis jejuensis TaxID=330084 RepID=UPI000526AB83|nr:TetR family transcriptional regulator [Amycolatopsis jejuensis]